MAYRPSKSKRKLIEISSKAGATGRISGPCPFAKGAKPHHRIAESRQTRLTILLSRAASRSRPHDGLVVGGFWHSATLRRDARAAAAAQEIGCPGRTDG